MLILRMDEGRPLLEGTFQPKSSDSGTEFRRRVEFPVFR